MLRNDGKYTIYTIQHQDKKGEWHSSNIDSFEPKEGRWSSDGSKELPPWRHFGANGECWQQTGVHGTFEVDDARQLLCLLRKHNKNQQFRVVAVDIWQDSRVVW